MFVVDYPRDHLACRGSERAAVVMRRMWIALLVFAVPMSACMARAGVIEIERIAVNVSDLGRTEAFYRDGLAAQFAGYAALYLAISLRLGGALKLFQWMPFASTAIVTAVGAVN